ncbi:MAG: hypothetical protein RLZZ248_1530 [Bacteroidota bacterium]
MNKLQQSSGLKALLAFLLICVASVTGFSQAIKRSGSTSSNPINTPPPVFEEKIWYGGGFNLGFSGSSFVSLFQLGISPMVGYKFTPQWSAGPRISLTYSYYSARTANGGKDNAQPISYAGGIFTRYKVIPAIFLHAEAELANEALVYSGVSQIEVQRRTRENVYLGVGYNSAGGNGFGYEILLLYNLNMPQNIIESPFDIRFGFNYKF